MHRLIMDTPEDLEVDHKNHNTLNNQRYNLRNCTHSQNLQNMKLHLGESCYKGVHWLKRNKRWMARIRINRERVYLGLFEKEEDAALAYNIAASKYFGEFAYLNILQ